MPEPEERFAMDEYSDMVAVAKPVVYITVGELVNTHRVRRRKLGVLCKWAGLWKSTRGWGARPWKEGLALTLHLFFSPHPVAVAGTPGLDRPRSP